MRKLSVEEVAKKLGVATSTYREWEYGRSIRGKPYEKLASILGVTIYELLTGDRPDKVTALAMLERIEIHMGELRTEIAKSL